MEDWFMIRELHAQGLSITAISDKTGYDRKTVRKYLNLITIPEPDLGSEKIPAIMRGTQDVKVLVKYRITRR